MAPIVPARKISEVSLLLQKKAAEKAVLKLKSELLSLDKTIKSNNQLYHIFQSAYKTILKDPEDNDDLQIEYLTKIPFDAIEEKISQNKILKLPHDDLFIRELLAWFKNDYFTWVNKYHCGNCGNSDESQIQLLGGVSSLQSKELLDKYYKNGGATNLEKYKCLKCQKEYFFPRYNSPKVLLTWRKGRCGEWAKTFYFFLKYLNYCPVRYIQNFEDHVWCEYYSNHYKRWIHLDPCENSFNEPLLYCNNWQKSMSYVFGIGNVGVMDLSNKYIDQRRKNEDSKQLAQNQKDLYLKTISFFDSLIKLELSEEKEIYKWICNDKKEIKLLNSLEIYNTKLYDYFKEESDTKGRVSGSTEWKNERGEGGN